jgi:hypothetical protein
LRKTENNLPHYCILAYRDQGQSLSGGDNLTAVAVVVSEGAALRIYLHPKLTEVVQPSDMAYMADMFSDLHERSQWDANGLFVQLCDLSVGPLITERVGENLGDDAVALQCISDFSEI